MQALESGQPAAAAIDRPRGWSMPGGLALAAIGFAVALVVYNNVAYAFFDIAYPPAWLLYPRAVILPLAAIAWAVWGCRLPLQDLGLGRASLRSGVATGFGLAIAAATPVALTLVVFDALGIDLLSFRNIDRAASRPGYALYWAFLLYPVHTVIFDELLFRGVLQGLGARAFGVARAVILSAGAFALWHVALDYNVLGRAAIAGYPALFIALQAVVLVAIFGGGLILGLLRERTGSVLAPIVFHWGFLVLLAGTMFVLAV